MKYSKTITRIIYGQEYKIDIIAEKDKIKAKFIFDGEESTISTDNSIYTLEDGKREIGLLMQLIESYIEDNYRVVFVARSLDGFLNEIDGRRN